MNINNHNKPHSSSTFFFHLQLITHLFNKEINLELYNDIFFLNSSVIRTAVRVKSRDKGRDKRFTLEIIAIRSSLN